MYRENKIGISFVVSIWFKLTGLQPFWQALYSFSYITIEIRKRIRKFKLESKVKNLIDFSYIKKYPNI